MILRRILWAISVVVSLTAGAQEMLLRERVELSYDCERGCELGDTIHFTARVTRDGHEGPTDYSRVLYVELLDPDGEVIQRRKLPLTDGAAQGQVWADTLYGTGFYELRAYTRYMTNWVDYHYWSRVVPIYQPPQEGDRPDVRRLRMKSSRLTTESAARHLLNRIDTIFALEQPIEKNLMVFGHIDPSKRLAMNGTPADLELGDRGMKLQIFRPVEAYDGTVYTDSFGMFALYFPDVKGDWNLRIMPVKSKEHQVSAREMSHQYVISLDELFAPKPRLWPPSAFAPEHFGFSKWKDDYTVGQENYFLDCDQASLSLKNAGLLTLDFYSFLGRADLRFEHTTGFASPTVLNVADDTIHTRSADINLYGRDSADPRTVCVDGPTFAGRPIVWIVDGAYRLVTGLKKRITDFEVFRPTTQGIPIYLDEVKSVFICDEPQAHFSYVRCSVLEKKRPVTVFITTRKNYVWDDSGLLSTYFTGFSE